MSRIEALLTQVEIICLSSELRRFPLLYIYIFIELYIVEW
jgi:hypothetical protein